MSIPHYAADLIIQEYSKTGFFKLTYAQGVKVTHLPTGIVVTEDAFRSQHKNRDSCFKQLEDLLEHEL